MIRMTRRAWLCSAAAFASLPQTARAENWPRSFSEADVAVTLEQQPARIVSTSPSLTGILLALDAPLVSTAAAIKGPLTDEIGFFRQWAAAAHSKGVEMLYPNLNFDLEAVILADPDLVVVSASGGDSVLAQVPDLQAQGLTVLVVDYARQSWEEQARILGRACGKDQEAEAIIAEVAMKADILRRDLARPDGRISIWSYNFAGSYAIGKPASAQGKLMAQMGFDVVGLPEDMAPLVTRSGDFDFVSLENLAAGTLGESIFLLNGTEADVAQVLADPVVAHLPAVKAGQVYAMGPTSFRIDYYSALLLMALMGETFAA